MMGMNFAAVLLFPAATINSVGDFLGLHGNKNTAGQFAMLAVFVWLVAARWYSGMWARAGLLCGAILWFLFLLGTFSRTSTISTVMAILFVIPLHYCLRRPVAGVIFGFCALFICLCTIFALIAFNVSFSQFVDLIEGQKVTLTMSRVKVWEIAYNVFLDHKLLGTGFGSLWLTGAMPPVEEYTNLTPTSFLLGLTQAHSGYFDVLATLGIVGAVALFLFLANYIWTAVRALASTDKGQDGRLLAELSALIFFASLIYNLAQSAFLAGNLFWVILVLCNLMLCSFRFPTDPEFPLARESAVALASRPETFSRFSRLSRIVGCPASVAVGARIGA
jgi:O-antigen ligase